MTQNSGKLGQVIIRNPRQIDWKLAVGSTISVLTTAEIVHSIIGVATDSKFGSWSIGRAIINHVKKNEKPGGPGEQDVEDSKKKNKLTDLKDEEMKEKIYKASHGCDENLIFVLGKFKEAAKNVLDLFEKYKKY